MKKKQLMAMLVFCLALASFMCVSCGSSDTTDSGLNYETITSDEYAFITRDDILHDNVTIIDTENSDVSCDSSGDSCYRFATRYYKTGSQTSVAVIDSSGNRFFFDFITSLRSNTIYEYFSGVDFLDQDLKMYVSYDSPELNCGETCANVYNYSDNISCDTSSTSKYYKITVIENSDNYLEFVFRIWNLCFLRVSDVPTDGHRSAIFQGHIKVKKKIHAGSDNYYHLEED